MSVPGTFCYQGFFSTFLVADTRSSSDTKLHTMRADTLSHVCDVYKTVTTGFAMTVAGATLGVTFGPLPVVIHLMSIFLIFFFMFTLTWTDDHRESFQCFLVVTFAEGILVSPLIAEVPVEILLYAACSTFALFVAITVATAVTTPDSCFIDSVGSVLVVLLWSLLLTKFFFPLHLSVYIDITLGLAVFSAYLMVDTVKMVWEYEEKTVVDPSVHALAIYLDLLNVFVRLLAIFAKRDKKTKKT